MRVALGAFRGGFVRLHREAPRSARREGKDRWCFGRGGPFYIVAMQMQIERLVAGPYCELFARTKRPGWDSFGNETDKFAPPKTEPMPAGFNPDEPIEDLATMYADAYKLRKAVP